MKILLVEDDDMLRKSVSFFLKANQFDVVEFDNGMEAIQFLDAHAGQVQLVITDLNLPFASGKEIILACKKDASNPIKVIALTSSAVDETELEVFTLGADDFISKPFNSSVLLKRIQKMLN